MLYINKIIKNSFFKESIIYGLAGALSKFSVFLTLPIFIKYLTIEEYGLLDLYLTIGTLLYIIVEMQIISGFGRHYYEIKNKDGLSELVGSIFSFYLISYLVVLSALFIIFVLDIESEYLNISYLLPIVLYFLFKQVFDINNTVLRMEHNPKKYFYVNIAYVFSTAFISIFFVIFIDSSIESILWSIFLGNFIFGVISYFNIKNYIKINLNFIYTKDMLVYGAPIVPAVVGGWAMSSVGRIYINEYLTLEDLGLYSLALKIGMIFLIFIQAFRTAWSPMIMKKFEETNSKQFFVKALNYYMFIGLFVVGIIYLLTPFLIMILANEKYLVVQDFIILLLLSYFWQGAINISATGNNWAKKTYYNSIGSLSGSFIVLVTTYFLIKTIGLSGVAVAQLLGFVISFFITLYFSQRNVKISYDLKYVFLVLILNIVICAFYFKGAIDV